MPRGTLHTPLCDLLGIGYPILCAGMGLAAGPELAAAVSKAGGFGVIGGGGGANRLQPFVEVDLHAVSASAVSSSGQATVSSSGLVSALLPGSATITATSGSVSGDAHVTVSLIPVRRITVTPDALSFTQGDPGTQLAVALLDSIGGTLSPAGHPITFASNNTGVASVSGAGFVTPGGPGQAAGLRPSR